MIVEAKTTLRCVVSQSRSSRRADLSGRLPARDLHHRCRASDRSRSEVFARAVAAILCARETSKPGKRTPSRQSRIIPSLSLHSAWSRWRHDMNSKQCQVGVGDSPVVPTAKRLRYPAADKAAADKAQPQPLVTLKGHTGYVNSVDWSPNGGQLAGMGGCGTRQAGRGCGT